ncbi:MFS transporter [Actinoplanes ianthinogenes]|uniref:MFS transporter n=2 Tax=Actinoplanes ianthinogenes TaxID=122358 RepID=A0ABN6CJB5_9ACTN|nr:MFS transporter [Actinoplanes ianthinogenes]GGQ99357.1 MFS transporter [Actinoplanes ianthinogenes]
MWTASLVAAVGGSFGVVAVPVQLYATTGSSAAVGAAAVVSFLGLAGAALGTGALADTRDRRRVLLAAQSGLAVVYLALWAQAALGGAPLWLLLLLVGGQGLSLGAISTTSGAVLPRLVPGDLLPAANSLSSLVRYTGSIVGPALAGLLIPVIGLAGLYLCDAVALLAVLYAVHRLPALPPTGAPPRGSIGRQVLAGFRYLAGSRMLVAVLAVDLAAMVFGMPSALYPELAARVFGPASAGFLYAAYPAGVVLAGLGSGLFTRARRHGLMMAGAAIAWGATVVVFSLTTRLWTALVVLAAGGAVNFVLSTFRNAISQAYTDDAMRGRIQGALTVVLFGGPQLANLLHGSIGALAGPRLTIGVGGLLTVVTVVAVLRTVPELRRYSVASSHEEPAT